jgi:N-acetylmuramoyl-L-alanine amidase
LSTSLGELFSGDHLIFGNCSMMNPSLVRTLLILLLSLMVAVDVVARPAIVVIDPGHGGYDRGGMSGQRLAEKVFTLEVAKRLARVLVKDGRIKVVLTRDNDSFVSLGERTNIANQYAGNDAVFVSIHFNAGRRTNAFGIESYYNNLRGYRLAALIHPRVIQAISSIDRGIRHRGFFVLRRNRLPAVLIECGFLTNPTEAARLSDSRSRDRLAQAIAAAIVLYHQ